MTENKETLEVEIDFCIGLTEEVSKRIDWLTNNYEKEISAWLGGEIKEGQIIIDDMMFPEQEVSGASVDTDQKNLIKLRKEYGDRCKRIIGHWHSHNTMSSFWSATDNQFIKEHMNGRELRVFLVSSTRDGIRGRVEIRKPLNISLDQVRVTKLFENKELKEELEKVIKEKVKVKELTTGEAQHIKFEDWYKEKTENFHDEAIKEEQEQRKEYLDVRIDKEKQNVKIKGLTIELFEKIDGIFPYECEPTPRGSLIDAEFKVGDKQKARKLRDDIREFINLIEEKRVIAKSGISIKYTRKEPEEDEKDERIRTGVYKDGFY